MGLRDFTSTPPTLPSAHLAQALARYLSAALVLLAAVPLSAATRSWAIRAQNVKDFTTLDIEDLVRVKIVTATLRESDPFSLPFMALALTRQDFQEQSPRSLPNFLEGIPGVMVQKTSNGQGSPFIRGFTGFQTLLLIDGVRLNNSVFRDGPNQYWNTVDPLSVDHLEIVKGPSSVLYGSDSIGGTVNARTIGRTIGQAPGSWDGRATYRYASAEDSHIARAEFGATLNEKTGLQLGVTRKRFGDLRGGKAVGVQRGTGYSEQDYDGKLEYSLRRNIKLALAHQTVIQDDISRTHSTIYGSSWRGLSHGTDLQRSLGQYRQLNYLQLHAVELEGWAEELHFSLSHHIQQEDQFRLRSNRRSERSEVDVNTLGASLHLESPSRVGRWTYGGTFYRDTVDSATARYNPDGSMQIQEIQGPVADDSSYDLLGFFVQNQLPSLGPVDLGLRGRVDRSSANARRIKDPISGAPTSFANDWTAFVGSARAMIHLDEGKRWNLFAGVGQGFRAPNLSDLTRLDSAASGQLETASTSLEPEHFVSYETGLKIRQERFELEGAFFFTDIKNQIIRTPTGRRISGADEVTKSNAGNGFVQGVEIEAAARIHAQWTAMTNLTWMEGRSDVHLGNVAAGLSRQPISRIMPFTSRLALRWERPNRKLSVEGSLTLAAKQDQLSAADIADVERIPPGGTPGYRVWTLRANWEASKHLQFSGAVENIFDQDYRIHGSGINEPGRNLVLGATIRF